MFLLPIIESHLKDIASLFLNGLVQIDISGQQVMPSIQASGFSAMLDFAMIEKLLSNPVKFWMHLLEPKYFQSLMFKIEDLSTCRPASEFSSQSKELSTK